MTMSVEKNAISPERKEFIVWLSAEIEKLNKVINDYNERHDYFMARKSEAMRDTYLNVLAKLRRD